MPKNKLYVGRWFLRFADGRKQVLVAVAAPNRHVAAQAVSAMSANRLKEWDIIKAAHVPEQLRVVLNSPGTVFWRPILDRVDYRPHKETDKYNG